MKRPLLGRYVDTAEEDQEITELAENLFNFRNAMDIEEIKHTIKSFLLANHYVSQYSRVSIAQHFDEIVNALRDIRDKTPHAGQFTK